jgi:uncharacterized YccA/Bax inhibitor family protein
MVVGSIAGIFATSILGLIGGGGPIWYAVGMQLVCGGLGGLIGGLIGSFGTKNSTLAKQIVYAAIFGVGGMAISLICWGMAFAF